MDYTLKFGDYFDYFSSLYDQLIPASRDVSDLEPWENVTHFEPDALHPDNGYCKSFDYDRDNVPITSLVQIVIVVLVGLCSLWKLRGIINSRMDDVKKDIDSLLNEYQKSSSEVSSMKRFLKEYCLLESFPRNEICVIGQAEDDESAAGDYLLPVNLVVSGYLCQVLNEITEAIERKHLITEQKLSRISRHVERVHDEVCKLPKRATAHRKHFTDNWAQTEDVEEVAKVSEWTPRDDYSDAEDDWHETGSTEGHVTVGTSPIQNDSRYFNIDDDFPALIAEACVSKLRSELDVLESSLRDELYRASLAMKTLMSDSQRQNFDLCEKVTRFIAELNHSSTLQMVSTMNHLQVCIKFVYDNLEKVSVELSKKLSEVHAKSSRRQDDVMAAVSHLRAQVVLSLEKIGDSERQHRCCSGDTSANTSRSRFDSSCLDSVTDIFESSREHSDVKSDWSDKENIMEFDAISLVSNLSDDEPL